MTQILVYGDSLSWGIVPGTRRRLPFSDRWPGVLEAALLRGGMHVRVMEDCLNGRRTVWEDPFKPGRNGLTGIQQRVEASSPLALIVLMLGTNDFQSVHQFTAVQSARGIGAIVRAIRAAPIEPGMNVAPILIVAPPPAVSPSGDMAEKFANAAAKAAGLSAAYRAVAAEEACAFFDAGAVISPSRIDGVHLDAEHHATLGRALVRTAAFFLIVVFPDDLVTRLAGRYRLDPSGPTRGGFDLLVLSTASLATLGLGLLVLAAPMRVKTGFRGTHEWLSGTRVLRLRRPPRARC